MFDKCTYLYIPQISLPSKYEMYFLVIVVGLNHILDLLVLKLIQNLPTLNLVLYLPGSEENVGG